MPEPRFRRGWPRDLRDANEHLSPRVRLMLATVTLTFGVLLIVRFTFGPVS